jgi:large subunit ribosomal protein L21
MVIFTKQYMKFAIVATCGRQYKFDENCTVVLDRMNSLNVGDQITFSGNDVVVVGDENEINDANNAVVIAEVLEQFRGEKIKIFKKRRRKHYDKCTGHRQDYTRVLVKSITNN